MKKIELGQAVSILANVGVIAGIIFLALELQQNNSLLLAQASYNFLGNRSEARRQVISDAEVAAFWARINNGAPLSVEDEFRLISFVELVFLNWQFEYGQYVDGNLTDADALIDVYRIAYEGGGFARIRIFPEVWRSYREQLRPDFVRWMEENVVSR